jgi:fimbrial chaperone protein
LRCSWKLLVRLAALGLGLVPGPSVVLAQAFQVTPVQVELTRRARAAVVTVHNVGSDPMRLQASAFEWRQDRRGEAILTRTRDVVFFPSLLTVAPGAKRNIRVAAAEGAPFGEVERSYRMFIEQLPGGGGAAESTVRVLTRVGIPVYLEPLKRSPRPEIDGLRLEGRKVSFVLRNGGNVRIRPDSVRIVGRDDADATVLEVALGAWYVLAGDERVYEGDLPRDGCSRVRTVAAEAVIGTTTVQARLPAPGGACVP